jgi:hypothetical protein
MDALLYRMPNGSRRRDTSKRLAEGQGGVDKCPPSRELQHLTRPSPPSASSLLRFAKQEEELGSSRTCPVYIGKCRFREEIESRRRPRRTTMHTRVLPLSLSLSLSLSLDGERSSTSPTPSTLRASERIAETTDPKVVCALIPRSETDCCCCCCC